MNKNFRVVETDACCIWFEYDHRKCTYHGFYDGVNLQIEEPCSESIETRIEDLCDEYLYGSDSEEY